MDKTESTRLTLVDDRSLGRIEVDLEGFFEFSFWLAEELEDMIATQRHQRGIPNASRPAMDRSSL